VDNEGMEIKNNVPIKKTQLMLFKNAKIKCRIKTKLFGELAYLLRYKKSPK
jgi:hypothetical protein